MLCLGSLRRENTVIGERVELVLRILHRRTKDNLLSGGPARPVLLLVHIRGEKNVIIKKLLVRSVPISIRKVKILIVVCDDHLVDVVQRHNLVAIELSSLLDLN